MDQIKRLLAVLAATGLLAGMMATSAGVALADGSLIWNGKNGAGACTSVTTGTVLWIFNPHSDAIPTSLTIDGVLQSGTWTNSGGGQNWHFTANIPGTFANITSASLTYTGVLGDNPIFTISGCNEGENPNPPAADLTVIKTAAGSYDNTYTWLIDKSVDSPDVFTAGGNPTTADYTVTVRHDGGTASKVKVTGTISVTNPNNDSVLLSSVDDAMAGGSCLVDTSAGLTVGPGNTDFPYTCTFATVPTGSVDNLATANWNEQTVSGAILAAGSASYTVFAVVFTPTAVDNCVTVTDTNPAGPQDQVVCVGDANPTTITYTGDVTGDAGTCTLNDNTATFTATSGATDFAKASVKDCQGADLTVTKTATPTFTRTYHWTIGKSVNKTKVTTTASTATFNYTVAASETGFTDSGWQVTGKITITNPNDWEDVTLTDLTDAVDNGGSCTVDPGPYVVPMGNKSIDVGYTCTYASAPTASSGTNTATATWDAGTYSTPTGSAAGTATFAFTTPTSTVNKSVTITDSFKGELGTLTATDDTQSFASATYTYSRTVSVPRNGCYTYDNTATIVETGQTANASVQVCGPVTGGLTMGFWQNKNGQGIITNYCAGTSTTSLYTYLRSFNPFKDLASTSCSGIATYVYNVIKAANASGSSMNAMLKAQDLATTLDVYFSTSGLGGNKIGAPTALGPVYVDLTKICKMIDGSGGTGTCSGTFENTTAAFGGTPTCQQISTLLTYAATQSNDGGSAWYSQNKSTQGLAKDTFDAINNGVAYSCIP